MAKDEIKLIITADPSGAVTGVKSASAALNALNMDASAVASSLTMGFAGIAASIASITAVAIGLKSVFERGFKAVDDYKTQVASMSAVVMTFMEKQADYDIGKAFDEAYTYAKSLVPVLEKIAAETLLTGQETQRMATEMAKYGVFLNASNKEAVSGFKSIANAIAIMTQGQDRSVQLNQEIRSTMTGQINATSQLGMMLKAINPNIESQLKTWQRAGTTLENMGKMLEGFDAATGKLALTWGVVKTTIETTVDQILRDGMLNAYDEIIAALLKIDNMLGSQKEVLQQGIYKAWLSTKGFIQTIANLLAPFAPIFRLIAGLVGLIADGLGIISTSILPPLSERIGHILKGMMSWVDVIGGVGSALLSFIKGDFDEGLKHIQGAKSAFKKAGEHTGKAFSGGFVDEVMRGYEEYEKRLTEVLAVVTPPKARKLPQTKEELRSMADALKAQEGYLKQQLEIQKSYDALQFALIENKYKLFEISDEDYYDAKEAMIWKDYEQNYDVIEKQKQLIRGASALRIQAAETELEKEEERQKLKTDIYTKEAEQIKMLNDTWIKHENAKTQELITQHQARLEIIKNSNLIAQEFVKQDLRRALEDIAEQQDEHDYLFRRKLLSASEYFGISKELIKKERDARIKAINEALDAEYEALEASLEELKNNTKEKEKLINAYHEKVIEGIDSIEEEEGKSSRKIRELRRDLYEELGTFEEGASQGIRDYLAEIENMYKKGRDLAESTAKAIENALVEMFDNPKKAMDNLFKYFVNVLKRMAVQALAQPIIIPLSTMMTGMQGGAGTSAAGGGGWLSGIAPYLGYAGLGAGIGGMMGGGTPGMIGGALGGLAGGALGGLAAPFVSGAISAALLAGAAGATMTGAVIGSAIPIIGTIIGAILGSLIGKLFKKNKTPEMFMEFQAGKDAGGYNVGKNWTGGGMNVEGGMVGFGYKNVGDWSKTEQQILELFGDVRSEAMEQLEALGLDISGFFKDWKKWFPDLKGKTAEEIQSLLKDALGEYVSFASGIDFEQWQKSGEDLIDTVGRILAAFKNFPKVLENIDDYIDAINDQSDEVALWKNSLNEASEKLTDMWKALKKLEDPADVLNMINQIKQATYDYYMSQIKFVQQLDAAISALEIEMANFAISMQQKISEMTGNLSTVVGMIWQHGMNIYQKFLDATTAGEKLTWLQQIISALDQWVAASIAAIQAQYQAQIEAINNQIEAINKQKEAINEQLEGLREQLRITQMWKGVVDQIKKQILSMMISTESPRDVFERMSYAKDEMERLRKLYEGATGEEKAKYAQELAAAIQAYMGLAAEAFQRPSPEYQAIYDEMIKLLDSIRGDAESLMGDEVDLLKQIKDLEEQSKAIDEQIKGLQEQTVALNKQMQADIEAFKADAAKYYEWAQGEGMRLYQEKLDMLKEKLGEILGELTLQEYIALKQKEATDALQSLKSWADSYWTNLQSVLAGGQAAQPNSPTPAPISPAPSETCPICNTPGGQHQAWCPYAQSWFGASGGIVTRATRAVIGEAGAEAVIPLSKLKDYTTSVSISPTINITANGNVSPVTLSKTIEQVLVNSIKYGKGRKAIQEII